MNFKYIFFVTLLSVFITSSIYAQDVTKPRNNKTSDTNSVQSEFEPAQTATTFGGEPNEMTYEVTPDADLVHSNSARVHITKIDPFGGPFPRVISADVENGTAAFSKGSLKNATGVYGSNTNETPIAQEDLPSNGGPTIILRSTGKVTGAEFEGSLNPAFEGATFETEGVR